MHLEATTERAVLVDPAGNRAEQVIEHRVDPLTGTVGSINTALGEKAKAFLGTADVALLRELEEKTRPGCPFCDADQKGTRFLPELVAEGQLRIGRALAMPNLFSKCGFDSVVVVDPSRHVLFPSAVSSEALADAIRASAELVRRARARDAALVHHVAGMNFLHPGGSSVPHPHLQVHVRGVPYSGIGRALRASEAWAARGGRSFWAELLEHERAAGARWIGSTGNVEWIAAWAPAHQREVWGILPGTGSLAEMSERDAGGFAAGITKVISYFETLGVHPFTWAFYSAPDEGTSRTWALHVRIASRPAFKALYANYDTWFTPKFLGDEVHTEAPERYAEGLRARW